MNISKKVFLILLIFVFQAGSLVGFGQIIFTKGYFVNNSGIKTECLIKNYDWRLNPVKVQYKLNDSADVLTSSIDSVKEFGIDDFCHYVRATVNIDRSPFDIKTLSTDRKPKWSKETVFLKELVCGKAGLWVYTEPEQFWFFYTIDNSHPEQLIYKEYLVVDKIGKNEAYKQQILAYLQNENTKNINIASINYDEKALVKYFKQYNAISDYCPRTNFIKPKREVFNLKIAGLLNYSTLLIQNPQIYNALYTFSGKLNWAAGLEAEYFLPFNSNTWSVLITPTYEHIHFSQQIQGTQRTMNLQSITFPIGGRYTKYFKKEVRCFVNAYLNPSISLRFDDIFRYSDNVSFEVHEANSFMLGGGVIFKNLGFELKYHTSRDLLAYYISWYSKYPKVSFSINYKLFDIEGK